MLEVLLQEGINSELRNPRMSHHAGVEAGEADEVGERPPVPLPRKGSDPGAEEKARAVDQEGGVQLRGHLHHDVEGALQVRGGPSR